MNKQEYKKSLGLWGLVSLGVGGTIGSGIFVVPGIAARIAGPSSLLSWLIAAISAGSILMSLAWVSGKFPSTGAFYSVFSKLFGKKFSLFLVFTYIVSSILGVATIAAGIGQYLYFFGISDIVTWEIAIVIAFTALNLVGMRLSGNVEILLTALKVIPLIVISIVLLQFVKPENFTPFFAGGSMGFLSAITVVYWSYTGFEISAIPADETKSKADIPKALFIVMFIVTVIYLVLNVALIGSVGSRILSNSPAPIAAATGEFFAYSSVIVAMIGIITMMSAMNAYVVGTSRVIQNISQEYKFPILQDLSARGTPSNALILGSAVAMAILLLTNNFAVLASASVITTLVPYIFIAISAFLLFRSKKIRVVSVIGILSTAAILLMSIVG